MLILRGSRNEWLKHLLCKGLECGGCSSRLHGWERIGTLFWPLRLLNLGSSRLHVWERIGTAEEIRRHW